MLYEERMVAEKTSPACAGASALSSIGARAVSACRRALAVSA
jgi:hypothetical protein